ncbi:MAG: hypothetical protein AAGK17_00025 [Pseudomonadota bacterium]
MMLSPRIPYVSPDMQVTSLKPDQRPFLLEEETSFAGLEPVEAAKLFSELIEAQS